MNNGGCAFSAAENGFDGMSLRDWFAGQAIAGCAISSTDSICDAVASAAYQIADAMLAARSKEPS